jgi:transposase-like protein
VGGGRDLQAARLADAEGLTLAEAARRIGVTSEYARQGWRQLFGDRPSPATARASAVMDLAADGAAKDLSARTIATLAGVTPETIRRVLLKLGVRAPNSALDAHRADVALAMADVRSGAVIADAASAHGITYFRLIRALHEDGISLPKGMGDPARRDGRTLRAIARVDAGETVRQACAAERVSGVAVYAALARRRRRLRGSVVPG